MENSNELRQSIVEQHGQPHPATSFTAGSSSLRDVRYPGHENTASLPHAPDTSDLPRSTPRSLRYLAETAERIANSSMLGLETDMSDLTYMERAETAIQAIEDRARTAERSYHNEESMDFDLQNHTRAQRWSEGIGSTQVSHSSTRDESRSTELLLGADSVSSDLSQIGNARTLRIVNSSSTPSIETLPHRNEREVPVDNHSHHERGEARADQIRSGVHILEHEGSIQILPSSSAIDFPVARSHHGSGIATAVNRTNSTGTVAEPSTVVERSVSARRDLERALRDYRVARRALRNHYANEPVSPTDQNNPTYQSVLAQLAEQRDRNRRMRSRGSPRLNSLDRSDVIVNGIAAAAGVSNEVWRSDDDETSNMEDRPGHRSSTMVTALSIDNQRTRIDPERTSQLPRSSLPPGVNVTSFPYLGPTSAGQASSGSSGGMREFYQRLQERRSSNRTTTAQRSRPSDLSSADVTTTNATTGSRRRTENERFQRLNDTIDRFSNTLSRLQDKSVVTSISSPGTKARNTLQYLSALKILENNGIESLALANELNLDSLADSLSREAEVDLPLCINELPRPQSSSWLEPGMSWQGVQRAGYRKPNQARIIPSGGLAHGPLFESGGSLEDRILQFRAWRHRERLRSERREREQNEDDLSRTRRAHGESTGVLSSLSSGRETLADVERHLSELLEAEERRLNRDGGTDEWRASNVNFSPRTGGTRTTADNNQCEDEWPVKVTLHDVDWQKMKVFGSMVARQVPESADSRAANCDSDEATAGASSMESYFDGEIIDFHTHELETLNEKPGYRVGGPCTDIEYWSRLGPFRQEVGRKLHQKDQKLREFYEGLGISGNVAEQAEEYTKITGGNSDVTKFVGKDDRDVVVDEVMAECLGSRKWLEKAVGEGGWIFMRWKERCFITSSSSSSNHTASTSTFQSQPYSHTSVYPRPQHGNNSSYHPEETYSTSMTGSDTHAAYGLTIRGFYYVALNRFSGKIEALYYDSGSQPLQALKMSPVGVAFKSPSSDTGVSVDGGVAKDEGEQRLADVGIRKEFGTFEFR